MYPSISQATLNLHFLLTKIIAVSCMFKKKKFLLHGKYIQESNLVTEQFGSLEGHVNHFTLLLYIIKLHQISIK